MLSESDARKRKLTEFINTNEYTTVEIQNYLRNEIDGNLKSLPEFMHAIQKQEYREADILIYLKQHRYELWMKLMSSEWFSILLQYLNLKDIAKVDTAFCSCSVRSKWLNLLRNFSQNVEFANNRLVDEVTNWLVLKHIHPKSWL